MFCDHLGSEPAQVTIELSQINLPQEDFWNAPLHVNPTGSCMKSGFQTRVEVRLDVSNCAFCIIGGLEQEKFNQCTLQDWTLQQVKNSWGDLFHAGILDVCLS